MKILVIDALGLHTGFIGCYGNDWIGTPTLDGLACEGIVFDNHLADAPLLTTDVPSSARTGRFGFAPSSGSDLLEVFRQRGWQVDLVNAQLKSFVGDLLPTIDGWQRDRSALLWVDGPSLLPPWTLSEDYLASYLEEEDDEPWLDPPQGLHKQLELSDWRRLRYTYGAVVTWFDVRLEEVCKALVERGWAEELLLCVTARAGLPLGEHGLIGEGEAPLHSERVHVPLIVVPPGEEHAGLRVPGLTQPVDLLPSLVEYAFREKAEGDGHSLWPLVREEVGEVRPFALAALGEKPNREVYLRTGEWALVATEEPAARPSQLFIKPEDRWEVNDLSLKHLEMTEELEALARARLKGINEPEA